MPQPLSDRRDATTLSDGTSTPQHQRSLEVLGSCAPALALAALLALAVAADLPLSSALLALAALLLTQVLPGALVWRAVRPRNGSWLEDLAMGFAIGSVVGILAQTVAGTSRMPWLSTGIPVALVLVLTGLPVTRGRILDAKTSLLPWWFAPLTMLSTLAAIPQLLEYFRQVPLTWASGYRQPHVDTYLHLALSGELAHRGPTTFPWVASEPLAYHWFSHAWVAHLSVVSGVELDQTLLRFMPAVIPVAAALIVATAALRLSGKAWTGPVAAALALATGDPNVFGQRTLNHSIVPLSPSLGLSLPMLVALVVVLVCRWRSQARSGAFLLIPLLALAAVGTKGSSLPLVVAGLGTAVLAAVLFNRPVLRTLIPELAVVIACLGFAVLVIFRASEGGLQRNNPGADARTLRTFMVVFGVLALSAGLLLLLTTRPGRRDPLTWLLAGGSMAGAAAVAVFAHPGGSQLYFAYNAIPLLALGSTLGLASMLETMGAAARRPVAIGLISGVCLVLLPFGLIRDPPLAGSTAMALSQLEITGAVLVVAAVITALTFRPRQAASRHAASRRLAVLGSLVVTLLAAEITAVGSTVARTQVPPEAAQVKFNQPLAVSRDQVDAARWIRDHSSIDDLVMTNRHCITPVSSKNCDGRRWVVAAFSERQMLLESWTATPRSAELAPVGQESLYVSYWKPEILALNDGFIAKPDATAASRLRALGVRWVFVDFTRPHAKTLEPFAQLRFQRPTAEVYELPPRD